MSSKLPHLTFIYNRYKKATVKTPASVEMRITYETKQKYISTGIMLYPNQWKNNLVVDSPDAIQLNQLLDNMLIEVRQIIYNMSKEGNINIYDIPAKLQELHNSKIPFYEFCKKRANIRKYGKTKDTQERYDRFLRLFNEYNGIKNYEDITESNIIDYDSFLSRKGMKPYSKWNNYHRFLNTFINDAIDEGLITRNPYRWLTIEKDKNTEGISRYLTPEEFNRLKSTEMPTKKLERIKDLFIFQTYTCLSYTDLRIFDINSIKEIKGMKTYIGHRRKTKKEFVIPILDTAFDILKKYDGKLPIISNVKYNEYLKVVAQASGIDKPLSTHWARHTGATLLLNEGLSIQIVSKICGHSSIRITEQIYAKLLDETVVNAFSEIKNSPNL